MYAPSRILAPPLGFQTVATKQADHISNSFGGNEIRGGQEAGGTRNAFTPFGFLTFWRRSTFQFAFQMELLDLVHSSINEALLWIVVLPAVGA